jgi:excisionase family DNA binding protein
MSRATLYRRVRHGEIRATRNGGRTYITEAEIHRYVANLEAAAS